MMVSLYISGEPVELFSDESVSITLQVRNYNDINKIYSDYSKPFTIPATAHNNRLLSHWYEQGQEMGLNAQNGIVATLSISGLPSDKLGMIELMSVNIEDGKPQSYEVVFYGLQRNVSAEIGEKRLAEIDWGDFNHILTYQNVRNSWSGSFLSGNVLYPVFDYGTGYLETSGSLLAAQNISQPSGSVALENLRPSFLLRKMLIKCFEDVGVTVQGTWTTDARLNDLYCLPMEKAGKYKSSFASNNWQVTSSANSTINSNNLPVKITGFDSKTYDPQNDIDLINQDFTVRTTGQHKFLFTATPSLLIPDTLQFRLMVNGLQTGIPILVPSASLTPITLIITESLTQNDKIWLSVQTSVISDVTFSSGMGFGLIDGPTTGVLNVDAREVMPDIKVKDFIKSCVDAFNLALTPINDRVLNIDFMQGYYSEDDKQDITPYVDTSEYSLEKIDVFKEINFKHNQKKDIANKIFNDQANRDYGSVRYFPESDFGSETLNIKTFFQVPAPDLIQTYDNGGLPSGDTDKDIMKAIDQELKPVQIPLALFYYCGTKAANTWYLNDQVNIATSVAQPQAVWPVCRTYSSKPSTTSALSLAFGFEGVIDDVNESAPTKNLLQEYWREFLNNTFDPSTRRLNVSARLPKQILHDIALKTLITVNGQNYFIEKMEYESGSDIVKMLLTSYKLNSNPSNISTIGNIISIAEKSNVERGYGGDDVFTTLMGGVTVLENAKASPSKDINIQVSDLQVKVDDIVTGSGDKHYIHTQSEASATWDVSHGLGKKPSVQVTTSAGDIVIGDIQHISLNNCVITFRSAFSGKATFN